MSAPAVRPGRWGRRTPETGGRKPALLSLLLAALLSAVVTGGRAPAATDEEPKTAAPPPDAPALEEELSVTHHVLVGGERDLAYTATAGTLILKEEREEGEIPIASVFFVAYTRDEEPAETRPLAFCFNGGPGSSSVWLHLGALGPRRVVLEDLAEPPPPPYRLEDNPHSLLDVADLVFVDPVTTGYSRAAPGEDAKKFHGVEGDVRSVGRFIHRYTTRFERWASPKFLVGESYGTTRAAGLAAHLFHRYGMALNGIALISPVLDFQTIRFDPGNDLPFLLFLPGYTAAAWYHHRLPADLQEDLETALAQAETFALGPYARALLQGSALNPEDRRTAVAQLSRYSGLPAPYLDRSDLRVPMHRFAAELLRDRHRVLGRFDARYTGPSVDPVTSSATYDPSYAAVKGAFSGALNHYLRDELEFVEDRPYEILAADQVQPWDYGRFRNRYLNVADTLARIMTEVPSLKILVASGYYDLATPHLATEYTLTHLGLPPSLADNIRVHHYRAGHMMYLHPPSRAKLKEDLVEFIEAAAPGN